MTEVGKEAKLTCQLESYTDFIWYKGSNKSQDFVSIYINKSIIDKFINHMNVSLYCGL